MALSGDAYPFAENGKTMVMDPATGERYNVDPNGQVMTPDGAEVPPWGAPTPTAGTPNPALAGPGRATPNTSGTFTPYAPNVPNMPAVDVQPGLNSQQWEANYNLALAAEKRLREAMEMVTEPQARASIDQAINAIKQSYYGNQVNARESQSRMTGKIPRWLPQPPQPTMGEWGQYQTGGLVSKPGGGMGGGTPAVSDEQAAQTIWNNNPNIQSMYKSNHPDFTPLQAVQDWWGWAPHEGAATLGDYARQKGWA